MKTKGRLLRKIMLDISFLLMMGLSLILWQVTHAASLSILVEKQLSSGERLIDYAREGSIIYAIISTTGDMKYGDRLLVFTRGEGESWERSYENDFTGLKPWKLILADIDGDTEPELLTAVRKTTFYDKEEKNRLFIFNYTDGKLMKKWTGSDIAGSWENFVTGDLASTKGEELIFISRTREGKERLLVYYWFDFGFLMLAQSGDYEEITEVVIVSENRMRITYKEGHRKTEQLMLKAGAVIRVP